MAESHKPTPARRRRGMLPILVLVLVAGLAGCLPIPDVRFRLDVGRVAYRLDPADLRPVRLRIPGVDEPSTPDVYDGSDVLRYTDGSTSPDTIVVMVPGLFGGAGSFDALARQLVAATPGVEAWAVDRRANRLEDHRGFVSARAAGDPELAVAYYLGRDGAPPRFEVRSADDLSFMAQWGLELHLRDLHAVVLEARRRAPHVVLAGHSLGASLAALYTAFRVDDGAIGADGLDGLVLLDGTLGRSGAFERDDAELQILGQTLVPTVDDVVDGDTSPYIALGLTPESFVRRAVIAHLAALAPEADAPPGFRDYPLSNRALAGLEFDERYAPVPMFAASVGEPVGATFHGNLLAVLLAGADGLRSRGVEGAAPGVERVTWESRPEEPSDLEAYLGTFLQSADANEWYFPTRLGLEVTLVDPALRDDPRFVPTSEVHLPTVAFAASRGLVKDLAGFESYANLRYGSPIGIYRLPGFTHVDVLSARENPVVPILQHWLFGSIDPRFGRGEAAP